MKNQNNDTYSLAHTTWKCQYHIVFTPKYHRKIIYGALREEIGKNIKRTMPKKRSGNHRGSRNARSHTYVGEHTAERESIFVYGVSQGQEYNDNLRAVCSHEV